MITLAAVCFSLCSAGASPPEADDALPFVGYVWKDRIEVRCGPGEEYYATSQLNRADRVEVYRRDPGGWLAIRPPEGSFSWVSAARLQTTDDPSVSEVVQPRTPAWVGSELRSMRDHRWQVELDRGERVEILGQRVFAMYEGAPPETWIRIAPPAGEFRWIRADEIRRRPPPELIESRPVRREQWVQYQVPAVSSGGESDRPSRAAVAQDDWRPAARTPSSPPHSSSPEGGSHADAAAPPLEAERPRDQLARHAPAEWDEQANSPNKDASDSRGSPPAPFLNALTALNVQLSLLAAEDPQTWRLAPIRQEARRLLQTAKSQRERSRAEEMLDRIGEFEDLQRRFEQWSDQFPAEKESPDAESETADVVAGSLQPADAAALEDPRFDGVGWLMPVHSTRREAPPFALLDDDGVVLDYVTPAPGLNLRRYERKEVGVIGQRSYLPALRTPHLTAHRVVDLARRRR